MAWPSMSDYQDAIQNPITCFSDPELRQGAPVLNGLGLPHPITGGFASVYQIVNDRKWAVRCFLHEYRDQQKRYEAIDRHLRSVDLPYKVGFEFQPQGIRIQGRPYPILKMEWIDGVPINAHIESILGDRAALLKLADDWRAFLKDIEAAGIAHGDLQQGNILVSGGRNLDIPVDFGTGPSMAGGEIRMIDYDGMYVPALSGMGTHEAGQPNYQHPKRSVSDAYGPGMDRFSGLVIHLAILALSRQPSLWQQFDNGDNILFCKADFENPPRSKLFAALRNIGDPKVSGRAMALQAACVGPVKFVPEIDDATAIPKLPVWVMDNLCAPPEVLDAESFAGRRRFEFSFEQSWQRPGPRFVREVRYEPVYQTRTRQVSRTVPDERKPLGWMLYLAIQIVALAVNPTLLIFSLPLGSFAFRAVKSVRMIETSESYQVQTGTRPVEEWRRIDEDGHDRAVTSISFTADGQTVLSAGEDKQAVAWNADSGERLFDIAPHGQKIAGIVPVNGAYFATASWDKTFRIYPKSGGAAQAYALNLKTRFYSIAADPAGKYIALGLGKRDIIVWDVAAKTEIECLEGHRRKVLTVAFFPDGERIASGSADMSVLIWDWRHRRCAPVLHGHTNDVNVVRVSPDGKCVASGGADGVIFVWDMATGRPALKINAGSPVYSVAFDPAGAFLISGGADRLIRCWDLRTGRQVGTLDGGHEGAVRGIALSEDGEKLATCGEDGRVIAWSRSAKKQGVI